MNDVVDDLFHKKHTQKSHEKFARYLRLTNMNLKTIPFMTFAQSNWIT